MTQSATLGPHAAIRILVPAGTSRPAIASYGPDHRRAIPAPRKPGETAMKTINMLSAIALTAAALAASALLSPVNAEAISHEQTISKQSAEALCKDHGGGTSCGFCHDNHCHAVGCDASGCFNDVTVYSRKTSTTSVTSGPGRTGTAPATGGSGKTYGGSNQPGIGPVHTGSAVQSGKGAIGRIAGGRR